MSRTIAFGRKHAVSCLLGTLFLAQVGCGADDGAEQAPVREAASLLGAGTFEEVPSFGSNPGALKMFRYAPSPAPSGPAPLVLAMHACTQDATAYRNAGWEELADKYGFYVVYPEQETVNNALRCFNWAGEYGNAANLTRGQGENESIKEMVDKMSADFSIDAKRVFAAGHSGGGAEVALMMAVWPDVFAAGGILAGIPYDCTTSYFEVSACLNPGKPQTAAEWGKRALTGYPGYSGTYPRLSVWQGTSDSVVSPTNQTELIKQWTNVHGLAETPTETDTVDGFPHEMYKNASGETLVEAYKITGADHGTFVDPEKGCGAVGQYFLDKDICSSLHMAEFFGIVGGSSGAGGSGSGGAGQGGGAATGGSTAAGGAASPTGGSDTFCVAGREKPCACPGGGESFKTCNDSGSKYGECDCPEQIQNSSDCSSEPAAGESGGWAGALLGLVALFARRRNSSRGGA